MNHFFKRRVAIKVGLSCLLIAMLISVQAVKSNSVLAQSPLINSEINSLKARITRLEQEVNRLRNTSFNTRSRISRPRKTAPSPPATPPKTDYPPMVDGQAIGPSNPLYERLATLLIELKEDVRNIEQRLEKVEAQVTSN
ncbi:hypothetical protein IQ255_19470 [Pleurocapsales cyanobacterium LEGE 10410]|nr:hypothetical protein [Pleurocapsales cyanobacterium LEGE 10410]